MPTVVRVMALVREGGRIQEVRVQQSSGELAIDLAATRVFEGAVFTPAMIEGIEVAVWAAFPVTFVPRSR
jgi:TonB family protein